MASPRRLPTTRLLAGLFALFALALPATAGATDKDGWSDVTPALAAAGAGSDTKLNDVAIEPESGAAVAVGEQGPGAVPVVYRRPSASTGVWYKETLVLDSAMTDARLTDVALTDEAAWAIGTYAGDTKPLVIRLSDPDDLSETGSQSWEALASSTSSGLDWLSDDPEGLPLELDVPRSIALVRVRGRDFGLIGDAEGQVFTLSGSDVQGQPYSDLPYQLPAENGANGAVSGIAFYSGEGFVVANPPETQGGTSPRIYKVALTMESESPLDQPTPAFANAPSRPATDESGAELAAPKFAGVATSGPNQATAIEDGSGNFWQPVTTTQGASWQRGTSSPAVASLTGQPPTLESTALADVSRADYRGPQDTTVVVGGVDAGVVWLRPSAGGDFAVQEDAASDRPLNGVAVASSEILVVGDGGVVRRYSPVAHSTTGDGGTGDGGTGGGGTGGGGGGTGGGTGGTGTGGGDSGSGGEVKAVTQPTTAPPPPPDENDQPNNNTASPSGCRTPDLKGENVVDISVDNKRKKGRRSGGKLIVRFKLRKPAKVRAVALRDGKVVGQSKRRKMKAGKNRVKISYRKAPETVRIQSKLLKQCPEGGTDNS